MRDRAAAIVLEIAERLRVPQRVATLAGSPQNVIKMAGGDHRPWAPVGLSDGYPGVALLFAELAVGDAGYRAEAHAYLSAGLAAPTGESISLFGGPVALAFAAHAASARSPSYAGLLSAVDTAVVRHARKRAAEDRELIAAGRPIGSSVRYDVISGGAGYGRYLLARHQRTGDPEVGQALAEVLAALIEIAVADDVVIGGVATPAWTVLASPPDARVPVPAHLNLGMAHGVGGPLALLALAWNAGIRLDRHDEAIARIKALLARWLRHDEAGPYWAGQVTLDEMGGSEPSPSRFRDAWCYGTAGLIRALHIAESALGTGTTDVQADAALRAVIATQGGSVYDHGLCHGWAGLLHIVSLMARETGVPAHSTAADTLAARVVAGYESGAVFGYRYSNPSWDSVVDRPGFLEGAAGIALALHAYAEHQVPATSWDAALLLN